MWHLLTIRFLLSIVGLISFAPVMKAQPNKVDSLLRALQHSKSDTNRVKIWLQLGTYQVYKPGEFNADMDSARTYARQAQVLSRTLGYVAGESLSLNLLGTISREARLYPQAIAYQQQAIDLLKRHQDARGVAHSYLLLAQARRDQGNTQLARKDVQTAIAVYARNNYVYQTGEAYIELGNTYTNSGDELTQKIKFYQKSLQLFTQAGNRLKQANVLKDLGDLQMLQGNHAQSLVTLRKSLTLYKSIKYPDLQGVYDLLGMVSSFVGNYQDGLKYGLLAVKTAESTKDESLQLCTIYNRVGLTYYQLKQNEKANTYYRKALVIAQKYKDPTSVNVVAGNIANVLMRLHQPDKALKLLQNTIHNYPPQNSSNIIEFDARFLVVYTELKRYDLAQLYCNRLIAMSAKLGPTDEDQTVIYWAITQFLLTSKQHQLTTTYLKKSDRYFKAKGFLIGYADNQLKWFKLDSMQGRYLSSIKHYQQYKTLRDSLFNEVKSKQLATLEIEYETEQKEQNLQLKQQRINILTKQSQLQNQQIKEDELVRNTSIGGSVLLLALLGLGYNRYRLKHRSNRQLQAQHHQLRIREEEINQKNTALQLLLTEKEWLLKEIHHRVKNNLQVIMSLLNSQASYLSDDAALSAIQESQHRVQAMALIHQKLYQSGQMARINMPAYIHEVVTYLRDAYNLPQPIAFQLMVDPIELDVTQAVPLGLIINEAVSNALKYAFPDGRCGIIRVALHQLTEVRYELIIVDDGVGLPPGYDPQRSHSLGMTLMFGFSQQLGGELIVTSPPGLSFGLVFRDQSPMPSFHLLNHVP